MNIRFDEYELVRFNEKKIDDYFLLYADKTSGKDKDIATYKSRLKQNPIIWELAHFSINLALILELVSWPTNYSDLTYFCMRIISNIGRNNSPAHLMNLDYQAYFARFHQEISITSSWIYQQVEHPDSFINQPKEVKDFLKDPYLACSFLKYYFVANHIFNLICDKNKSDEGWSFIIKHANNTKWTCAWYMLAAFLSKDSSPYKNFLLPINKNEQYKKQLSRLFDIFIEKLPNNEEKLYFLLYGWAETGFTPYLQAKHYLQLIELVNLYLSIETISTEKFQHLLRFLNLFIPELNIIDSEQTFTFNKNKLICVLEKFVIFPDQLDQLLLEGVNSADIKVVKKALYLGVDINTQYDQRNTALHIAARNRELKICSLLVKHGASISLTNEEGKTACEVAADFITKIILQDTEKSAHIENSIFSQSSTINAKESLPNSTFNYSPSKSSS
ncbi:MAG: hypothetical protein A3F11_06125 [Gammaproteobacteria bacterium RIFCSPHIGHO2_12_FULL_37_14]|nr:MAG: hypothetical protein A3F11_06125 [Gammaproteobacteria bacterium RIFCSPHIGHO2_12_FULL_37_14]